MKRRILQTLFVLVLANVLLLPTLGRARGLHRLPHVPQQSITKYTLTPNEGRAGQEYDLVISSSRSDCQTSQELSQAKLIAPQGVPIEVLPLSTQAPCTLTTRIKISENASVGKLTLWVGKEKETPLGIVEFNVIDNIPAGVIPPGMKSPAVDVMWSVMPKNIVSDNFGKAIANRYYAVEIIIGNNSAYTLQLVSVGFELPSDRTLIGLVARNRFNKQAKSLTKIPRLKAQASEALEVALKDPLETTEKDRKTLLPTSSYKITRGTLESKHITHARTLVLSTITALGPIFTGFTPYFHNVNHRGNFTEFINIFSNPLEKGLELVWPDLRPRQRERFDDQVLRDGLIIRNNTQVRTLAFFPKELLTLPKDVEDSREYNSWKDNAREVRERLGDLVIVGDLIQYVNRISLVPNPPGPITPPPSVYGITPNRIKQGSKSVPFTITGANLEGTQLIASGAVGIHIDEQKVDPTGRAITGKITVDESVAPGIYQLIVATPAAVGSEKISILVEPEKLEVTDFLYEAKAPGNDVEVTAKGKYLHNANFRIAATPASSISVRRKPPAEHGKSLSGIVTIPAGTKPGKYKIEIVDDTTGTVVPKELEVKSP